MKRTSDGSSSSTSGGGKGGGSFWKKTSSFVKAEVKAVSGAVAAAGIQKHEEDSELATICTLISLEPHPYVSQNYDIQISSYKTKHAQIKRWWMDVWGQGR